MPCPPIGAAVQLHHMDLLRDWLFDADRPIEIQDFLAPDVIAGDTRDLVAALRRALDGHRGPRGVHGPFFGLDLSNPDLEIRAIIQRRLIRGIEISAALRADMMVIHSPFTFWHVLNYTNYAGMRASLMEACAACLAPVLEVAEREGVTLVLENLDDTSPDDRADLAARMGGARLQLSVDTGHAELAHQNYGAPPLIDMLGHAGATLGHVHLQDVDGHADRHWHPGDGQIAWRPVMQYLARSAPGARLILEVHGDHARLPRTAAMLADLVG